MEESWETEVPFWTDPVRPACLEEYQRVMDFYDRLTDGMEGAQYHPGWEKGVYPDPEFIRESIKKGELFVLEGDGKIAGAMVMNHQGTEGYDRAGWKVLALPEETAVLHALGVLPEYQGRGLAKRLVRAAVRMAVENGCRAVRLDVLEGNLPAKRLYESTGFQYIERMELFYEDTGLAGFWLYELELGKVRPAEAKDREAVYRLMCQLENQELPKEGFDRIYGEILEDGHFRSLVYDRGGRTEGFVNLRMEGQLHHGGPVAEILELVVGDGLRGQGIGEILFHEACRLAGEAGCMCLDLTSGRQRTGAHRFYERQGMKKSHFKFTMEL
ncbi:MAG TPA: GNAT family N-acetyltransferase [Candidatus Lachnoclostridium stercorigallinarum]|uniref:GNAT family N-acetyltransferase n=1 Tax=Candidatus Lachnoclostridium stercorigallinarum TaxID=2838634 RepID=A0A9D2K5R7_9FIRM|nr:GNAT family N-acetyltransferase [Candidatus Lachnoclostridium stercorigallinarum]